MRIASIRLSWFRGAAAEALLEPSGHSMLIYGPNGSGKSSFVDAIEVCISGGKVAHLSHEYSGKNQEKGLLNTQRPTGTRSEVEIGLTTEETSFGYAWQENGTPYPFKGKGEVIRLWDKQRVVLRQDELVDFIKAKKSEKYSSLLPLLGLTHLEVAAENIRKIGKEIGVLSKLDELRQSVTISESKRKEVFGDLPDEAIIEIRDALLTTYATPTSTNRIVEIEDTLNSIKTQISALDDRTRQIAVLHEIGKVKIPEKISNVKATTAAVAKLAAPLLRERLDILRSASTYLGSLNPEPMEISCPACGSRVLEADFRNHVVSELEQLEEIDKKFAQWTLSVGELVDDLNLVRSSIQKPEFKTWLTKPENSRLKPAAEWLLGVDLGALRANCREVDIVRLEAELVPLHAASKMAGSEIPPALDQLLHDKDRADALRAIMLAMVNRKRVARIEKLISFNDGVEAQVREEIKKQAETVFESISKDIQAFWEVLHPFTKITDVRLYTPRDAIKAIDVALSFYGKDQESPRLTLSEGYRNSLGLCIFLAMAKQGEGEDLPIILDDVVVSLDRNHRSMVAALLQEKFKSRQVLLFTHDREWFFELSRRLSKENWNISKLLPWIDPQTGLRIAKNADDFASARAMIMISPEDAESSLRRIVDQGFAEIAEHLGIPMPYLRGDENDHRTGGQFIGRIASRAKKSLQRRVGDQYEKLTDAYDSMIKLEQLLQNWANRGTHSFSAAPDEARILIDVCERVFNAFSCGSCNSPVWYSQVAEKKSQQQCKCGQLCWRD